MPVNKDYSKFENLIGYTFKNKKLLTNALTHSSYSNEKNMSYESNNERIEFLGDAVLEVVSSDYIFKNYPKMHEGDMTKLRASLVCEYSLAITARQLNFGDYIILGNGEKKTGGASRDSILSDAVESVIGAIYLDSDISEATKFIHRFVLSDIENKKLFYDSKSTLQEMIQSKYHDNYEMKYNIILESGPDHNKEFVVVCVINGNEYGTGKGRTKKAAEQKAAYETILILRKEK